MSNAPQTRSNYLERLLCTIRPQVRLSTSDDVFRDFVQLCPPASFSSPSILFHFPRLPIDARLLPKMPVEVASFIRSARGRSTFIILRDGCRFRAPKVSGVTSGFCARISVASYFTASVCDLISSITSSSMSDTLIWRHSGMAAPSVACVVRVFIVSRS
jgi:hypothetical protein